MKRIILLCLLVCLIHFGLSAQESTPKILKNEVKVNFGALLFKSIDLTYEFIINDESGVGISMQASPESDRVFSATPYYRFYFGEKRASGFFAEVNVSGYSYLSVPSHGSAWSKRNDFCLGTGLAIGKKFINKRNFTAEIYGGFGRDFMNDTFYPRCGVTIAKRF